MHSVDPVAQGKGAVLICTGAVGRTWIASLHAINREDEV